MNETTKPVAVLFDVDETLVHTGGAGAASWKAAFDRLHGVPADIGEHTSAGETDPEVGAATFRGVLGRDPTRAEMTQLYAAYLRHLAGAIWASETYRVLPGAQDLLVALADAGVLLGVVSGAMEGAARIKLTPANLNRFFVFGAYGSDSPNRTEVTRLAIDKAAALHGEKIRSDQVFVVGDTPHDVSAAHEAGAVAVAVASGHYDAGQLRAARPEHVLDSLRDRFPGL